MASLYNYNMGGSNSPHQSSTPFIPPANLLGNTSPYNSPSTGPRPLPGGSPHSPNIPLPGAPNTPLYAQLSSPFAGYRPPSSFQIHPCLNGEYSHGDFAFDISAPKFAPMRCTGPGHWEYVPPEDLVQPATWPYINQLRILCDSIPQWPIDFTPDPNYFGGTLPPPGTQLPAITLGDVLIKIYNHFGQRITHMDWTSLSPEQETAISRAYMVRCKALGSAEAVGRSQGVKRIDYTGGKVWFKGLTRVGDGVEVLKLHLAKRERI